MLKQKIEVTENSGLTRLIYILPKEGKILYSVDCIKKMISSSLKKNLPSLHARLARFKNSDPQHWEYTINELLAIENQSLLFEKCGIAQVLTNNFSKHKRSDTLVVLGSGPSIAKLKKTDWEAIKQMDSVGFNFWLVHPFTPSFYVYQGAGDLMKEAATQVAQKYMNVPIIIRGSEFGKGNLDFETAENLFFADNPLYTLREYPIHSECNIKPVYLYNFMEAQGYLNHGKIGRYLPKWRSTIGLLLSLGYAMGYREIVLAGADMQSNSYFWDESELEYLKKEYVLPKSSAMNTFVDDKAIGTTVPDYIKTFSHWAEQRSGMKISVVSKQTILYPDIPLWTHSFE